MNSIPSWRRLALLLLPLVGGCAAVEPPTVAPSAPEPPSLVGPTERAEIEAAEPSWVEATVEARPEASIAIELLAVEPAEVTIFFGTWCSDSRRELARFWRALDGLPAPPPMTLRYVAVDRSKQEPRDQVAGVDLRYVPTFVVERQGRELGRVIEEAPGGIESDLLDLLSGRATGWISARDDLPQSASAGPDG